MTVENDEEQNEPCFRRRSCQVLTAIAVLVVVAVAIVVAVLTTDGGGSDGATVRGATGGLENTTELTLTASAAPTAYPSILPTTSPSVSPSSTPSLQPSELPTTYPTLSPSAIPSREPTTSPSDIPSSSPVTRSDVFGENPCEGKSLNLTGISCFLDGQVLVGPQSAVNVTKGYNGLMEVANAAITLPFSQVGLCPVNVHWHLGAEHLSVGELDESGSGPLGEGDGLTGIRQGFQCQLYNETETRFTEEYNWQHCIDMKVGQTYEVHWSFSAAGSCGTIFQYQTPDLDGIFCNSGILTDTVNQIGVQTQVFTIVNDESYYHPQLFRGMLVSGEFGQDDIAMYTGSSTDSRFSNEICSQYSPISWHVDRKCHLICASTFDKNVCGHEGGSG